MARLITLDGLETLDDILAPGLDVLFCGYNPATYAVAKRHYYARRANRFWEDLHEAGFTPHPLRGPDEDLLLPTFGLGLTDLVKRPSPNIDALTPADYQAGAARLDGLLALLRPRILCFNGLGLLPAYTRWGRPPADVAIACVPSTSPRNQRLRAERLEAFRALKARVDALRAAER
jgi:TDG/mug DNA glycosylase family protein